MLLYMRVILVEAMSSRVKTKGLALQQNESRRYLTVGFRHRGFRGVYATRVWLTGSSCGHNANRAKYRISGGAPVPQKPQPQQGGGIFDLRIDPYFSGIYFLPPAGPVRGLLMILRCMS